MYYYEYALSDYENEEHIILGHEKKFGDIKFRRLVKEAHKIMMTEQPYIDLLPQESIVHEETRSELDDALRLNPDKYTYYVCENTVHDIVVRVLTERLGFVKIDIRGAYYYSTWRTSCIEVPAEIVQEPAIDVIDNIDYDDENDEYYIDFLIEENE